MCEYFTVQLEENLNRGVEGKLLIMKRNDMRLILSFSGPSKLLYNKIVIPIQVHIHTLTTGL